VLTGLKQFADNVLRRRSRIGLFGRTEPLSTEFGFDRGLPIDRYYIENFLQTHSAHIHGRTLEVGDDAYTRRFGADRTRERNTIHINSAEPATFHGDLTVPGVLPSEAFDCIVITQTLHLLFNMGAAIAQLHDALKPGASLLVTVPGITPIAEDQWGKDWYWSLTPRSLLRLLNDQFGAGQTRISCFGNVFSGSAFLYGLATQEVSKARLDALDPRYPVIVGARAVRDETG
jgi:SAM-dependent methyltransferase